MSAHSNLDRESFQKLLASALLVQQSLIDVELSSAILTVRQLISAGKLDAGGAMHLIAARTQNVANATGVALGLLKGDQLVYRAGTGSAAIYRGRHVIATLSASANTDLRHEILRVEDAQTDARIGAAICRQFGARSLLILPIYHDRALAGVLEVFFNEAHAFQDGEVCAYQSMAGVVGEAMAHAVLLEQKKVLTSERGSAIPEALAPPTPQMQRFPSVSRSPANKHAVRHTSGAAIGDVETLWSPWAGSAGTAEMIDAPSKARSLARWWRVANRAAVAIVLVTASWIAYNYRGRASTVGSSQRQRSNAIEQQVPLASQRALPAERYMSKPQTVPDPMEESAKAASSTPRRVRVGDNEVDYISDDVTVRQFISPPSLQGTMPDYQADYISDDVTVRYFTPKPAVVSPSQPVGRGAASARSKQ
jgi:hypothetical protein